MAREKLLVKEAYNFVHLLKCAYNFVRSTMEYLQQSHQLQANKKCYKLDFNIKDKVWLLADNIYTDRPSHKLNYQQIELYTILEKRGYLYLLEMPKLLKGKHQVFHASLLCKAPNNPLPGQIKLPPPSINLTGDDKEHKLTAI